MFTIAARYLDDVDTVVNNERENGTTYLADAQKILSKSQPSKIVQSFVLMEPNSTDKVYRYSRTSTIQSLLLLGIREFGIGMFQSWHDSCPELISAQVQWSKDGSIWPWPKRW